MRPQPRDGDARGVEVRRGVPGESAEVKESWASGTARMHTIQLALTNRTYAKLLREALARSGTWKVKAVEIPEPEKHGIVVVDEASLGRMPMPLANPERVVLIARKDPQTLARAWDAGIRSVVYEDDPPATAALAIMAATLRMPASGRIPSDWVISPSRPEAGGGEPSPGRRRGDKYS